MLTIRRWGLVMLWVICSLPEEDQMDAGMEDHIRLQENFIATLRGQKASAESAGDVSLVATLTVKIADAEAVLARLQAA